jgi:hypothetical protein
MSHASTVSWVLSLLPSGIPAILAAALAWIEHLPGSIILTIFVFVFATIFLCTLAWLGRREQYHPQGARKALAPNTAQTGVGGDYDLREPSPYEGIRHTIRVKIINDSESVLIGAKLSIINLSPPSADQRNFPLPQSINLSPSESTYIRVVSHTEGVGADKNFMQLQTPYPGGYFPAAGYGILTGEHRFTLRLTRNEERLAEIYCRLYIDDLNVMRLESLDKCEARNGL